MGVVQKTVRGTNPCIPRVVSKSDSDHESGYYGHRILGLMLTGTIYHGTHPLGHYPILSVYLNFVCADRKGFHVNVMGLGIDMLHTSESIYLLCRAQTCQICFNHGISAFVGAILQCYIKLWVAY